MHVMPTRTTPKIITINIKITSNIKIKEETNKK
jgi:hypothetical protein